jgi:hypothetical protein
MYAPPDSCRACHAGIAESYRHVAMARSLYPPTHANVIEDYQKNNTLYHAASDRHYRMTERQGRFYQQRFQLDGRGHETNAMEVDVTYIIGSGNRSIMGLGVARCGLFRSVKSSRCHQRPPARGCIGAPAPTQILPRTPRSGGPQNALPEVSLLSAQAGDRNGTLPFRNPITDATGRLGGIAMHMCT